MDELKISPTELFGTPESITITINGITTKVLDMSDSHGNFLAISATDKSLSDICGDFILGKFIKEIDYLKYQGKVAIIKAYY